MSSNSNIVDGPRVWIQGINRESDTRELAESQLCTDLGRCVNVVVKILEDNNLNCSVVLRDVPPYIYFCYSDGRKRTVRFEKSDPPLHSKLRMHRASGVLTKKGHTKSLGDIFRLSYDDIVRLSEHLT